MSPVVQLLTYCLLIALASLTGGWMSLLVRLTHQRMEMAVSAVAGFMLGLGLLLLLPEALHHTSSQIAMPWLLGGFLATFYIERFFCFHHHDAPTDESPINPDHGHDHRLTWGGAAFGLSVHSVIAGVALGTAAHVDEFSGQGGSTALAMFLMILLHKPFDSLTLGTLMQVGDWTVKQRHVANLLFALAVPAGAGLAMMGLQSDQGVMSGAALAFATGTFLCIAMSDLLPELQFHQHDRVKLSSMMLLGIALAWGISQLHDHEHAEPTSPPGHQHDQDRQHDH